MEKAKLKRIVAICIVCISFLMPIFSQAGGDVYLYIPNEVNNTHLYNKTCTEPMKMVGTPWLYSQGIRDHNDDNHILNVWACKYQCPKCKETFEYHPAEYQDHQYPSKPEKVEKGVFLGWTSVTAAPHRGYLYEHTHWVKALCDISTYKCACGHTKEKLSNLQYTNARETKPVGVKFLQ